ncbi:MAG: DUF494 family protein [Ignavibacteriales bacterium]|jgi:uncharacterized protein Smg (DUF494 family)|nr:DUF494 family protein [Ignavibacteriales bacterium]
MTSKVVEVLAKILEALNKDLSLDEIGKKLSKSKEFDDKTLNAAFALLYDKLIHRKTEKLFLNETKSIRHLSQEEIDVLGTDNYNYLLHLYNLGLIDSDHLERILYQITLFPELKVSKTEINLMVIFSLTESNSNLLPGSRILLNSSDTVN